MPLDPPGMSNSFSPPWWCWFDSQGHGTMLNEKDVWWWLSLTMRSQVNEHPVSLAWSFYSFTTPLTIKIQALNPPMQNLGRQLFGYHVSLSFCQSLSIQADKLIVSQTELLPDAPLHNVQLLDPILPQVCIFPLLDLSMYSWHPH